MNQHWIFGRGAVLLAATLACSACSSYLARRDTLSESSGDAVASNAAIHVIDPWPPEAFKIDPMTSGERAQRAIERYRNPASGQNGPGGASASPVAAAPTGIGGQTGLR